MTADVGKPDSPATQAGRLNLLVPSHRLGQPYGSDKNGLVCGYQFQPDAAGTPAVYWLTQDFNTQARQLYDRIAAVTPFIRYNRKL